MCCSVGLFAQCYTSKCWSIVRLQRQSDILCKIKFSFHVHTHNFQKNKKMVSKIYALKLSMKFSKWNCKSIDVSQWLRITSHVKLDNLLGEAFQHICFSSCCMCFIAKCNIKWIYSFFGLRQLLTVDCNNNNNNNLILMMMMMMWQPQYTFNSKLKIQGKKTERKMMMHQIIHAVRLT